MRMDDSARLSGVRSHSANPPAESAATDDRAAFGADAFARLAVELHHAEGMTETVEAPAATQTEIKPIHHWIGGKTYEGQSGRTGPVYNPATGALSYDVNGNAAGGATQFATLATGLALTNADFVVG